MIVGVLVWLGSGAVVCLLILSVIEKEVRLYREAMRARAPKRVESWDWDFDAELTLLNKDAPAPRQRPGA